MKTLMGFIPLCFLQGVVDNHDYYITRMMREIVQVKALSMHVEVCYK